MWWDMRCTLGTKIRTAPVPNGLSHGIVHCVPIYFPRSDRRRSCVVLVTDHNSFCNDDLRFIHTFSNRLQLCHTAKLTAVMGTTFKYPIPNPT